MATEVLTAKDQLRVVWKPYSEASFGAFPGAVAVDAFPSHVFAFIPRANPNTEKVFTLRGESATAGTPLGVYRHFWEYGLRIHLYQHTLANWANSWQRYLMKTDATYTNFWAELKMYHSATLEWYINVHGMKPDIITIRCAKDEKIEWILDCFGEDMQETATTSVSSYNAEESGDPWFWANAYWQIDPGGGYVAFPDILEDWTIVINRNLYQRRVFDSSGSYELAAIDEMGYESVVRMTVLTHDETWMDYLLDVDEVDIRLQLPDSKTITFSDCKFQQYEPDIRVPRDMIRSRVEFNPRDYSENF
jgi:hypothetical protein